MATFDVEFVTKRGESVAAVYDPGELRAVTKLMIYGRLESLTVRPR